MRSLFNDVGLYGGRERGHLRVTLCNQPVLSFNDPIADCDAGPTQSNSLSHQARLRIRRAVSGKASESFMSLKTPRV
jgi:hypothetical protein